jgi:hypothetical protein
VSAPAPPPSNKESYGILPGVVLVGSLVLFATGTPIPWYFDLAIAVSAVALATAARAKAPEPYRSYAVGPVLAVLVLLAAVSVADPIPELLGAAASLAVLVWLTADPRAAPGGVGRAGMSLIMVLFVVVIAWASAVALPSRNSLIGLAGGLLVFSLVVLAIFIGRPEFLDRGRSANP